MTAPLKWRSQLCPCGYCPDGTRIEWRYRIDIRFKPRRTVSEAQRMRARIKDAEALEDAGPARTRNVRKALGGSDAGD